MSRFGSLAWILMALALAPASAEGQFVLRNDTAGWGWLAMAPPPRAVVLLAYGSPQTGDQGLLDLRVLADLRSMGLQRVESSEAFEPTENQVVAECTAVDYTPPGSEERVYTLHTEISFWDHTRLAATEIYEAITLSQIAPTDLASDTYVDRCVGEIAPLLVSLGFDQG